MTLSFRSFSAALLSLATAAAPAALASSSTAGTAQSLSPAPAAPVAVLDQIIAQLPPPEADQPEAPSVDRRHVECIAKIIMHEAAYEPRSGRIAVAQVIRARIRDGRFATNACAVARQRGQFFNLDAFNPPRGAAWDDAVAIAADTLSGDGDDVVPGALYFHASYSPMPGHARVGQIGGHVFYR